MNKLFAMSVRDVALGAYMTPFFAPSIGMAERGFRDELNNPDSPMHKHPGDYDLWCCGEWDPLSGVFQKERVPFLVLKGLQSTAPVADAGVL